MCYAKTQCAVPTFSHSTFKANSFNVTYWNIHGWKSKIIDNKLADPDFLRHIENCDILGLSELHTHDPVSIPG